MKCIILLFNITNIELLNKYKEDDNINKKLNSMKN